MTQPFVGQIQCFGFGFAPVGWALCQGQLLPISQYAALFSLIGTFYGGNGTSNFGLPNLQSRVPVGQDTAGQYPIGSMAGVENVTLNLSQMPAHNHAFLGTTAAAASEFATSGCVLAQTKSRTSSPGDSFYGPTDAKTIPIIPSSISFLGSGLSHPNIQPYTTVNWCIALTGIFPPRG